MNANDPGLVDELARLTTALATAYEREKATRIALLRLHALMGICVGLLVLFTGAGSKIEGDFGTWSRAVLGALALASGVCLWLGIRRKDGTYFLEIAGLALMGLWDLLMAVLIGSLIFTYDGPWTLPGLNHPLPFMTEAQPRPYAFVVYLALASMVWGVHLRAVLYDRRQSRV